jgi:hypothetical protein
LNNENAIIKAIKILAYYNVKPTFRDYFFARLESKRMVGNDGEVKGVLARLEDVRCQVSQRKSFVKPRALCGTSNVAPF